MTERQKSEPAKTDTTAQPTTPTVPVLVPPVTDLQTANLIEGLPVIAEWIRFAEAKAAVVLTVGGAVGGLAIPTLKGYLAEATAQPYVCCSPA